MSKTVVIITMAVDVDKSIIKRYSDYHYWFEEIIEIPFEEPKDKLLDADGFIKKLKSVKASSINYSLLSNSLQSEFAIGMSDVDMIKEQLLSEGLIEFYEYEHNGKIFKDGIKYIDVSDEKNEDNKNE